MPLNTARCKGTSANQSPRFLPAASLGNRGPLFPQNKKNTECAECLCRFLTFDICALIAPCYRAVFLVIVSSSIQGFARLKLSQACFLKLKTELLLGPQFLFSPLQQQKRHSSFPEDLHPPLMLLKATQGFPHGNFYTCWQVAQTPGLRKTPNDD